MISPTHSTSLRCTGTSYRTFPLLIDFKTAHSVHKAQTVYLNSGPWYSPMLRIPVPTCQGQGLTLIFVQIPGICQCRIQTITDVGSEYVWGQHTGLTCPQDSGGHQRPRFQCPHVSKAKNFEPRSSYICQGSSTHVWPGPM
jgi:hypothetical protein